MKGLWQHPDGRLKTGMVSAALMATVLAAIACLMQVKTPVKEAVVSVIHVMEPESAEQKSTPPEPSARKMAAAETAEPDPEANVPEVADSAAASAAAVKPKETVPAETKPEPDSPETMESAAAVAEVQPEPADASQHETETVAEAADTELKNPEAEALAEPENPVAEVMGIASEKTVDRKPPEAPFQKGAASASKPETAQTTVDTKTYLELMRSWQAAPGVDEKTRLIGLQVEQLRNAYDLFQMKVVAVVDGKRLIDLEDGTRIADSALDSFSGTCFKVSDPWSKWGSHLKKAGIGKGVPVEVRYYMYSEVRNAIYHRAGQAVEWCRKKGAVSANTQPGDIDVTGRAYTIRRNGGGAFGVFIPCRVMTRDGASVEIPASCFQGAPDVKALMDAGVL